MCAPEGCSEPGHVRAWLIYFWLFLSCAQMEALTFVRPSLSSIEDIFQSGWAIVG